MIHALPGADDELWVRAIAHEVSDPSTVNLVRQVVERSGAGGMIDSVRHHPLFEFDVQQVDTARYVDIGRAGTLDGRSGRLPTRPPLYITQPMSVDPTRGATAVGN